MNFSGFERGINRRVYEDDVVGAPKLIKEGAKVGKRHAELYFALLEARQAQQNDVEGDRDVTNIHGPVHR